MTKVLKVAKSGFNVLTTGNENLSFSSLLASHSIYDVVTVTKTSPATSVTHTHSLGYVPKVWVFVSLNDVDGDYYRRIPQNISSDRMDFYITSTTVVIETDATATMSFRVVIFTRSPNP